MCVCVCDRKRMGSYVKLSGTSEGKQNTQNKW